MIYLRKQLKVILTQRGEGGARLTAFIHTQPFLSSLARAGDVCRQWARRGPAQLTRISLGPDEAIL